MSQKFSKISTIVKVMIFIAFAPSLLRDTGANQNGFGVCIKARDGDETIGGEGSKMAE
jgi:hypothetical protein